MDDENFGRSKGQLTADKFRWLQQVAGDPSLPPPAAPIAIFIASEFTNSRTGDAYPGMMTLAARIGRSETQTREAIKALVARSHLKLIPSRGGARHTNRYRMNLKPLGNPEGYREEKPSGNPKGCNVSKPLGNPVRTPRESGENPSEIREKPLGNPEGIPLNNPVEDSCYESASGGGPEARQPSAETSRPSSADATMGAPRRRALGSAPLLSIGDEIIHDQLGRLEVRKITSMFVTVRETDGNFEVYRLVREDNVDLASSEYVLDAMA